LYACRRATAVAPPHVQERQNDVAVCSHSHAAFVTRREQRTKTGGVRAQNGAPMPVGFRAICCPVRPTVARDVTPLMRLDQPKVFASEHRQSFRRFSERAISHRC